MRKWLSTTTLAGIMLAGASMLAPYAANAAQILAFGQTSGTNTITATASGATTTITGTNVAVLITQILGGGTPSGFFDLNLTSVGAVTVSGGQDSQAYSGSFSFTSGSGDTETNYLSGTFTDTVFGIGSSLTLTASQPPGTVVFTSSVIPASDLGNPLGFSLGFVNVTPAVNLVPGGTRPSFTASVSGNASASPVGTPMPEPATLALLGVGLAAIGVAKRRRAS